MPFSSRSYVNRYVPSNRFPTGVKWLLIVTSTLSVLDFLMRAGRSDSVLLEYFSLIPSQVVPGLAIWRLLTYLFLHSGIMAVVWNMLALWMFGAELERTWGTRRFVTFYLSCGVIGAVAVVITAHLFGGVNVLVVGSTASVFGILVAYAVLYPNQTMLFGFLIPIKTKYFVMIIGAIVLLQSYMAVAARQGAAEVIASLAGLIAGYLLLRGNRLQGRISQPISSGYKDWKLRRARKKFEVYLRKKDSNPDRWVH
jgi:membrane associated rhomboid family serine protease